MNQDKKYILLVEDNVIAAIVAKALLESFGCIVDVAHTGEAAVEMAIKNAYHGISMDIGLPYLSGVEACIAIRAHEIKHHIHPPVPIIAVSANSDAKETQHYIEAGMQGIIAKPLSKEKITLFLSFCTAPCHNQQPCTS